MRVQALWALWPLLIACSGAGTSEDDGTAGSSGNPASNGGPGSDNYTPIRLQGGSRELDGVVNLVDATAAQELEDFIALEQPPTSIFSLHSLNASLNLFLDFYVEQYDFVFFFTDHPLPSSIIGKFEPVTRPATVGTGNDVQIAALGYRTNGRVKGVIGIQYSPGGFGPFAHEMLHYWAVHFDDSFGFGKGLNEDVGAHWGYAGVHGQLGGFDPATLSCDAPVGALPPDCEPLTNGRFRYRVGWFYPNANGPTIDLAPTELYLMGLLPLESVPQEIPLLLQAEAVDDSFDPDTETILVEADGVGSVSMTDIVDRHGEVKVLSNAARDFSAAFVVLSATPAADDVLNEIAQWAAIFGGRQNDAELRSFAELTQGLATLDTELGPRRGASQPRPPVRPAVTCDLLAQDCEPAGVGCYLAGLAEQPTFCALSGGAAVDESCTSPRDCAPGLTCVESDSSGDPLCSPFCDHQDEDSPRACQTVCDRTLYLTDDAGNILNGQCVPP